MDIPSKYLSRREAVSLLGLLAGAVLLPPACRRAADQVLPEYDQLQVTGSMRDLIGDIAGTFIPTGEIKGASDIMVQDFVLRMINDCHGPDDQRAFMAGLEAFEAYCRQQQSRPFQRLGAESREVVLSDGLETKEDWGSLRTFLNLTRQYSIEGYLLSEYIQIEIKPYSQIPGPYQGAVRIADLKMQSVHG